MDTQVGFSFSYQSQQLSQYSFQSRSQTTPDSTLPATDDSASAPVPTSQSSETADQDLMSLMPSLMQKMMGYLSPAYLMNVPQMGMSATQTASEADTSFAQVTFSQSISVQFTMSIFAAIGFGPASSPAEEPPADASIPAPPPTPTAVASEVETPVAEPVVIAPATAPEPEATKPVETPVETEVAPAAIEATSVDAQDEDSDVDQPIKQFSAEDFSQFRSSSFSSESVNTLALSITTQEGDLVTIDFSQIDVRQRSRFAGTLTDGGLVRAASSFEGSERLISMSVTGDLSDAEKDALDEVLKRVVKVANKFFKGSIGAALNKLKGMKFDMAVLSELSLKMSMTRNVEFSRAYQGGEGQLAQLASRDIEVHKVLDLFAEEQKNLIDMAGELLDRKSAAKLVKSLLPAMLEGFSPDGPDGLDGPRRGHGKHAPRLDAAQFFDLKSVDAGRRHEHHDHRLHHGHRDD